MPIVTSRNQPVQANTEGAGVIPRKTIVANTSAALNLTPFSAPDKEQVQESPEEPKIGQPDNSEAETKSEAVTLSPKLTALARREQKFRQQEQAFKAKEQALEAERAKVAKAAELQARLEAKDYSVLDELGVSYEEYTNHLLNKGEADRPESQAIKRLESEVDKLRTQQEDNVNKQYEATVDQYRRDIKNLVARDPAFESVKETNAEEHVLQHILDTFNEDGEVLTVDEAAKEIEEFIVEDALKMAKLKKVQSKLTPPKPVLPPPQQKQGLRTLTQQIAPSTPRSTQQFQHLSPRERLAQAIAKAQKPPQ